MLPSGKFWTPPHNESRSGEEIAPDGMVLRSSHMSVRLAWVGLQLSKLLSHRRTNVIEMKQHQVQFRPPELELTVTRKAELLKDDPETSSYFWAKRGLGFSLPQIVEAFPREFRGAKEFYVRMGWDTSELDRPDAGGDPRPSSPRADD